MSNLILEKPRIEFHHGIPFAITRLNLKYAHLLSRLAVKHEPEILNLEPNKNWVKSEKGNETSARYSNYNIFLLNSAYMNLFISSRNLFRFLLNEIDSKSYPCYIRSWLNITRFGNAIHRHTHQARFIGSFQAFSEGSYTSYGPLENSDKEDHSFENKDGVLMITKSNWGNFHQVSEWKNKEKPRVTYAFDIVDQCYWKKDRALIPFDGI